MTRSTKLLFSALSLAALAHPALAQEPTTDSEPAMPPPEETTAPEPTPEVFYTKLTWPEDFNARPLTLAKA